MEEIEVPTTPTRRQLSRDERLEIRILRSLGWPYTRIQERTGATLRQIAYTATTQATPQKRSGRPPILSPTQVDELIEFISSSKANRRMPYVQIPSVLGWNCGEYAIRYALRRAGYKRYHARRKPPISEKNRITRLNWARSHLGWTIEEWGKILWSDETWITPGKHCRTWVTRKQGEELNPTCIVEREQRKNGWMFWGCFSGKYGKGPGIFWEKDWGKINKESYCAHTVPIVHGWCTLNDGQVFMQDGAPGHSAQFTRDELYSRGIRVIFWPPYSPDLNPIETIWCIMKDYLAAHFPEKMSYDRLREAVKEAWEAIKSDVFFDLLATMHDRCQAVIDANGMHTKY